MKRCDPNVRAKCPDGKLCELNASFADGSWCDDFNEQVLNQPMANADCIRSMSDRELASFLAKYGVSGSNLQLIDEGYKPTATQLAALHEQLATTWMRWLRQPAGEVRLWLN